ncbi:hypothetical protein WR25_20216 [Diploscapter pachys]|uniref:ATP-dependent DNA helicase RecQ zinc-binding domain-containing protein n=1 Tax=Diploscapter pachys TaxID=2018661 RepID=A0A2A2LRB4_9BILA|nr:hypothetical protein WR25_20216 [Diploscapter pachys]
MEHCFRGDSNRIKAKKGLSDDAKDIQIKALQTGFEKMIEYCEKTECRHKMMVSFFNESVLKKCLKNCNFCRIPEKVSQQANALKTAKERRGIFWIRERAGENGKRGGCQAKNLFRTNSNVVAKRVNWQMEELRGKCVESLTIVRREAIVRTVIQALDGNSSQTGNQLTSNTTPAICSPRHSAPTTTRLHSLECNQERDKEWN